jgi:uncharacterized membrane protein
VAAEVYVGNRSVAFSSAVLSVEKCYDATLILQPSGTVCLGDSIDAAVSVGNIGSMKDYYTLSYPGGEKNFSLEPDEKTDMKIIFAAAYPWSSQNNATFTLSSRNGVKEQGEIAVRTLSKEKCYSVGFSGEEDIQALRGKGTSSSFSIVNTGMRTDTYALSLAGPGFAYLSAKEARLAPGKNVTVYVYASPPYDADEGAYNITVIAESKNAFGRLMTKAAVADSFPEEGTSSSGLGLSGMLVGSTLTLQVATLSLMALLTVVIVLMRFVIYK